MVRERRFREAIELLKAVPKDIKDTQGAIETATRLQTQLMAQRKSEATANLIFLVVGLTLAFALMLAALISASLH